VTDPTPFGDIDKVFNEALKKQLDAALSLDQMDQDVNTWEAGFLQSILDQLRIDKRPLSQKQIDKLREMCEHYEVEVDL
jgi:hypothetical protein